MTGRTTAAALAALDFKVFPIKAGSKTPPLWSEWPDRSTTTITATEWPDGCNVGIHCTGLCVIDVDPRNGGSESLTLLDMTETGLPLTLSSTTPSGGNHLFYRLPEGHPGVVNRAGKLAPGIDIKSTRGYVVGAGSRTAKGEYRWVDPAVPIAPAPEWLVQRLDVYTTRVQAEKVDIPDADPATVERALAWLAERPGAVEGSGGDAFSFETVAFLRDYGLSAPQTLTLLLDYWNPRCSPPWEPDDLSTKVQNVYRYATGTPGSKAVTADDFPDLPNLGISFPNANILGSNPDTAQSIRQKAPSGGAQRLGDFVARRVEGPGYLVKGALSRGSYAEAYGPPGSGKTFLALDLAYHVAAGTPWMDRKVRQGLTLYLAYEGTGGLVKRAQALRQKYGTNDVPLYITPAAYNLRDMTGRQAIGSLLATLPEKPTLIVIDTFARALMGGDENSAQDVGAFNNAVQALIESTGACVLILHHTGKDVTRGARGSSALQGAVDTEIAIDGRSLQPTKQRDIETGAAIGFKLVPVIVGLDDDDDDITSCVVESAPVTVDTNGVRLSGNNLAGWETLIRISPNNEPVTSEAWKDACVEFLGSSNIRKRFYDIKSRLEKLKLIVVDGENITRRMTE